MLRGNKSYLNKEAVSTDVKASSNSSDFAMNFKKLHKNSQFKFLEKNHLKKLLEKFGIWSSYKWGKLQLEDPDGHGFKSVPISSLTTTINSEGNTDILSFRVDLKFRMFGFREENIFYPIILDTDHNEHNK